MMLSLSLSRFTRLEKRFLNTYLFEYAWFEVRSRYTLRKRPLLNRGLD